MYFLKATCSAGFKMKELFFLVAPFLDAGGEQITVESERGVPDTFLGGAFVFRTLVLLT
jgi:hypothetical protein